MTDILDSGGLPPARLEMPHATRPLHFSIHARPRHHLGAMLSLMLVAFFVALTVCGCGYFSYSSFYKSGSGEDLPLPGSSTAEDDYDGA